MNTQQYTLSKIKSITIYHRMEKLPNIRIYNEDGIGIENSHIIHETMNSVRIDFPIITSGMIYLTWPDENKINPYLE